MSRVQLPTSALAVVVAAVGLTVPAFAFAQSCGAEETLTKLFNYSQLAERPEAQKGESTECPYGHAGQIATPDELTQVSIPKRETGRLSKYLQEKVNDKAFVESLDEPKNILYVGCRRVWDIIDIAVELRLFRRAGQSDLIRTDVVGRDSSTGNKRSWTRFKVRDNIVVLPGTTWPGTVPANFFGEVCAFPAARFTVFKLCEEANRNSDAPKTHSLLTRGQSPTLVGHSLGATTVQFIMSAEATNLPACPKLNAYAFSSLGLTADTVNGSRADDSRLTSYLSDCDRLTWVFGGAVQPGELYILSNSNSHSIDAVQGDLCTCLKGTNKHRLSRQLGHPGAPKYERICSITNDNLGGGA